MTAEKLEGIESVGAKIVTIWGTRDLVPVVEDSVAKVLATVPEISEDEKLIEQLNILQGKLEPALIEYAHQYKKTFDNIKGVAQTIEYGMGEGLKPESIAIETIFSGLHKPDQKTGALKNALAANMDEDTPLFRDLLSELLEKDPKTQAAMLSFFELINTYAIQKADEIGMHKNPLKKMLFDNATLSYKDWIVWIFQQFNTNEEKMIALSKSLILAESPRVTMTPNPETNGDEVIALSNAIADKAEPTSRELIRYFFQHHADQMSEEDRWFLDQYYKNYPDDSKPVAKGDDERKKDVAHRNAITPKYIIAFTRHGVASEESMQIAKDVRDACAGVILQSWETPKIGLSE